MSGSMVPLVDLPFCGFHDRNMGSMQNIITRIILIWSPLMACGSFEVMANIIRAFEFD